MAMSEQEARTQLDDLGWRIERAVADYSYQGLLHGPEREAAAEIRLKHGELAMDARAGRKRHGELAHDIAVLKSTFERWLARVDRRSEQRRA